MQKNQSKNLFMALFSKIELILSTFIFTYIVHHSISQANTFTKKLSRPDEKGKVNFYVKHYSYVLTR